MWVFPFSNLILVGYLSIHIPLALVFFHKFKGLVQCRPDNFKMLHKSTSITINFEPPKFPANIRKVDSEISRIFICFHLSFNHLGAFICNLLNALCCIVMMYKVSASDCVNVGTMDTWADMESIIILHLSTCTQVYGTNICLTKKRYKFYPRKLRSGIATFISVTKDLHHDSHLNIGVSHQLYLLFRKQLRSKFGKSFNGSLSECKHVKASLRCCNDICVLKGHKSKFTNF